MKNAEEDLHAESIVDSVVKIENAICISVVLLYKAVSTKSRAIAHIVLFRRFHKGLQVHSLSGRP